VPTRPNVLLITLDQFRGDCLSGAGHGVVRTPNLDGLATTGVRLARHYAQASPCAPGRASLYTGTYQMNHRVVGNGTPLDDRFDNVARMARRAGYDPTLFGYTDQGVDPRVADGPDDPRLCTYEGVLPGFSVGLHLPTHHEPWRQWLVEQGYDDPGDGVVALATEPQRPSEHGVSAYLTDSLIHWLERREGSWFAHASYLRPHPPYAAAGRWSKAYHPDEVGEPIAPAASRHPFHDVLLSLPESRAPIGDAAMAQLRAQYFGMISDVDEQLGRLWAALRRLGFWDNTLIVVTADHGEQLGDHGVIQKVGWFEQSHHIVGIVRDPHHPEAHGQVVHSFTENVDILPTIADAIGVAVPDQCDGRSLSPWLRGEVPPVWRDAAHWEFDWRSVMIGLFGDTSGIGDLDSMYLTVTRSDTTSYVQFGDGSWLCFDLAADPTWRTPLDDLAQVLAMAQQQLVWRGRHADRTLTGLVLERGGVGRWPTGVPWRS
jgi:arylsulfatase A-like enzyme